MEDYSTCLRRDVEECFTYGRGGRKNIPFGCREAVWMSVTCEMMDKQNYNIDKNTMEYFLHQELGNYWSKSFIQLLSRCAKKINTHWYREC